ncbi:MAG TPA: SDR family oxidoreductase, partial [Chromatiales bacterium]|nr:SDR family oxidoreductase [Chromatiales bacterium]
MRIALLTFQLTDVNAYCRRKPAASDSLPANPRCRPCAAPTGYNGYSTTGCAAMNDLFDVSQQTVLVTGASSGLGRHFAQTLAGAGANVVLAARRRNRLDEVCTQIRQNGGQAIAVNLDVTDPAAIAAAFDAAESAFGTVDVVVNNAGIGRGSPLHETSDADWQATLDTNLTGVHRVASEAVRRLIDTGTTGSIVNIASILGLRVAAGTGAYNASKAAVIHLTKSQALEWARYGIRANVICPGYFPTEI